MGGSATHPDDDDTYLWLEEVSGSAALQWVSTQNARTQAALDDPPLRALEERLLAIYTSDARIPHVVQRGESLYNFWQDRAHARGVWRRTTWDEYVRDDPDWEVLLDIDALAGTDGESWVWEGAQVHRPHFDRALVSLSRGGADAVVVREFDLPTRAFVSPHGFVISEAKTEVSWLDRDHVLVGTDLGPGTTTDSGYPRQVRLWARGTELRAAPVLYEGETTDVSVWGSHDDTPGFTRTFVGRSPTFFTNEVHEWSPSTGPCRIDKPPDTEISVWREWLLLHLRTAWQDQPAGSLLVARYAEWLAGGRSTQVLFAPTDRSSLESHASTRNHVVLTILEDVRTTMVVCTPTVDGWERRPLEGLPAHGTSTFAAADPHANDVYFLTTAGFLNPTSLAHGTLRVGPARIVKQLPALFDSTGLAVEQHFATSADGTRVPYFQIGSGPGKPTLLTGYGGFEISLRPFYAAGLGAAWLEAGGTLVVANIRGGGEYGPRWHQAALRENRPRAYEDFAAVASDLVERGVTEPARLGALGGSNGGLLVGNMLVRYPERFGAIVCQVPLLDMRRYHRLLAGASWMEEYGDPDDPAQWSYLQLISPFHRIPRERTLPPTLFVTSTRDDRVHPGHARKMAARLEDLGHPVLYYENTEGGHGAAADHRQQAHLDALTYRFLWTRLAGP